MKEMRGVVVGIVKEVGDSKHPGCIQVEFPWLQESYRSDWVPIAVPMAGKQRGAFFMPEKEDEVLVAFEHGDFDHPFIIGFLWNGVDTPPDDSIDPGVRRLRTVSGHVLEFDDRFGSERVLIQSKDKDGHQLELKDMPPGHIKIKTRGDQEVNLSDFPPSITIKTRLGAQITISDALIEIKAPSGALNVDCALANVVSKSLMSVNAPIVQFSGTVLAPTLIATSVVSSAYTPAPGNTFGL